MCTQDKILYLEQEWTSVALNPLDCVSISTIKNQHDVFTRDLLVETFIRKTKKDKNADTPYKIPADFLALVNSDIIYSDGLSKSNKRIWVAFGNWLGFKGIIKKKQVKQHIRLRWKKIQHGLDLKNNESHIKNVRTKRIPKKKKNHMKILAFNLRPSKELVGFQYIVDPQYIVNKNN